MAISLQSLQRKAVSIPPILLFYGTAGMGKTSLAVEFPDAAYIQILPENPPHGLEVTTFGELATYSDILEALGALAQGEHLFKTVIIDSLTALEPLIWKETCFRNQWKDIEQPGYGKGYLAADHVWREFIDGCDWLRRNKGLTIVWLGLAEASNHEEPGKPPYKRYEMRMHKRADGLLTQTADAVLFINTKVEVKETEAGFGASARHADGGGTRWLFTDGRPAFVAKNRLQMPDQIQLPKGKAYHAISKFLPVAETPALVEVAQPAADAA
jgi:AAA domain